ncbi:FtsX-like permease family protein [Saprospiraceae bacterium]|nr:FtsX-like permease family protein [Saprospiraceae bacterium]MDB4769062.1 FtsX-like permease family protein [Saprospiraceae bacterium]MDC3219572.1 FtsX-like permease family protein [Saprospiraceae bacterium]
MSKPSFSWLVIMAWRDSRRNISRLLLFISSIVIGIAALVAINSFSENLQADIDAQAQTLLGADLKIESNQQLPDSLSIELKENSIEKSTILQFVSMASFPKTGDTRLSMINGLEGGFPFYGKLNTTPIEAAQKFKNGKMALVDKSMLLQFNMTVGDSIKVGEVVFEIAGQLNGAPGSAGITSSVTPSIFIPMDYIEETQLIQIGSRVDYQTYFLFDKNFDIETFREDIQPRLRLASARSESVASRKENISEAFDTVNVFLNLVGFIALLLGCIGVASAVHIYIKDKISTVSILRCLGASGQQAFLIYLLQIVAMGFVGSMIGALLGSGIQVLLPAILKDFLPLENISSSISIISIGQGVLTGLSIAVLFALLPLLSIRRISPLRSLRASFEDDTTGIDPLRWLVYVLIFIFITAFTFFQTGGGAEAIFFPIGIGLGLLLLAGIAKLAVWAVRKFFPTNWSFVWRQSIANLYRPNNQTLTLIVSIGLGTTFISVLFFTQDLLLQRLDITSGNDQPNMLVYNIQGKDKDAIADLAKSYELPVLQNIPIVTMRLESIDDISKAEHMKDTTSEMSRWVFRREYRVSYRDTLNENEEIIKGSWHGNQPKNDSIFISISERLAEGSNAGIGTKIIWNVQGALIETFVGSIRKRMELANTQARFFVLFPNGVLEKAPQFYFLLSRAENPQQSADFQKELVKKFPSVLAGDFSQVLKAVDEIIGKVSFVIRFMALFSIMTGLLVLISSVVLSKYQRIQESVLLRTLGAKSRQILMINALEYFMLGALATLTGIGLAFIGSYLLATFLFDIPFTPNLFPTLWLFLSITGLTLLIGLFNSREVLTKPPLEVLRKEA